MVYQVKFYTGSVKCRQRTANTDGCICYIEHHFNSCGTPTANYGAVLTVKHPKELTIKLASYYAVKLNSTMGTKLYSGHGLVKGGFGGRGMGLIKYCKMPALILEPGFVSFPAYAEGLKHGIKVKALASVLAETIQAIFPDGGLVGFSVGHKYRGNKDLGAPVHGGGHEADLAEMVLEEAKILLELKPDADG